MVACYRLVYYSISDPECLNILLTCKYRATSLVYPIINGMNAMCSSLKDLYVIAYWKISTNFKNWQTYWIWGSEMGKVGNYPKFAITEAPIL